MKNCIVLIITKLCDMIKYFNIKSFRISKKNIFFCFWRKRSVLILLLLQYMYFCFNTYDIFIYFYYKLFIDNIQTYI